VQFTIVTYRTTPDLVTALLRGEVDLGFDYFAGFESTIGPDKLRIIATRLVPRSDGRWPLRMSRIGCCGSDSMRGGAHLKKCTTEWQKT